MNPFPFLGGPSEYQTLQETYFHIDYIFVDSTAKWTSSKVKIGYNFFIYDYPNKYYCFFVFYLSTNCLYKGRHPEYFVYSSAHLSVTFLLG